MRVLTSTGKVNGSAHFRRVFSGALRSTRSRRFPMQGSAARLARGGRREGRRAGSTSEAGAETIPDGRSSVNMQAIFYRRGSIGRVPQVQGYQGSRDEARQGRCPPALLLPLKRGVISPLAHVHACRRAHVDTRTAAPWERGHPALNDSPAPGGRPAPYYRLFPDAPLVHKGQEFVPACRPGSPPEGAGGWSSWAG